jgi:hypothetical protein
MRLLAAILLGLLASGCGVVKFYDFEISDDPNAIYIDSKVACEGNETLLVAQGDSWFNYAGPGFKAGAPYGDILSNLSFREDPKLPKYCVVSAATAGKTLDQMNGDPEIQKMEKIFAFLKKKGVHPKAVLLSGAGDDAYRLFSDIVSPFDDQWLRWSDAEIGQHIDEISDPSAVNAMTTKMLSLLSQQLDQLFALEDKYLPKRIPILVHGYDYAIPDEMASCTLLGCVSGPWLAPAFNGYDNRTKKRIPGKASYEIHDVRDHRSTAELRRLNIARWVVRNVLDVYNDRLLELAREYTRNDYPVVYIDLRGTLVAKDLQPFAMTADSRWTEPAISPYLGVWQNELHPNTVGFERVAALFGERLDRLSVGSSMNAACAGISCGETSAP